MTSPLAAAGLSWSGDVLVALLVLGGLVLGSHAGLFRSTLAGVLACAALVVPLALADRFAAWLVAMDVPARIALGLAFLILLGSTVACLDRLAGLLVSDGAMRLGPVIDLVGGSCVGAVTGGAVAGIVLVAWSIMPLPHSLRPDPAGMNFDAGGAMLAAWARCAGADPQAAAILLRGEPRAADWRPPQAGHAAAPVRGHRPAAGLASETFVDRNGNRRHDEGEEYLDADGSGGFSPRLWFDDVDGNGRRRIGLLERYSLGNWDRVTLAAGDENDLAPQPPRREGDDDAGAAAGEAAR